MIEGLKQGQKAFLNKGISVEEVTIVSADRDLVTVRFDGGGGTRVHPSRLYVSMEEAAASLRKHRENRNEEVPARQQKTPWQYR